jgi:hypothetical protein
VGKTITDPYFEDNVEVCGKKPKTFTETFPVS